MFPELHDHLMTLPTGQPPGIVPRTSTPIPGTAVTWSYLPDWLDVNWLPIVVDTFATRSGIKWFGEHPLLMDAVQLWCKQTSRIRAIKAAPLPPRGVLRVVADAADVKRGFYQAPNGKKYEATEVGQEFYRKDDSAPEVAQWSRGVGCDHITERMMEDMRALHDYRPGTSDIQRYFLSGGVSPLLLDGLAGYEHQPGRRDDVRGFFQPPDRSTPREALPTVADGVRWSPVDEEFQAFSMPLVAPVALLGYRPKDPTFTYCDVCLGVRGSHDPGCKNAPLDGGGGNAG